SRDRGAGIVLVRAPAIRICLLVARERLAHRSYAAEPLDARHPVPARNDQTQRVAVLRRQRGAVQLVGEHDAVRARLLHGQAAAVELLPAAVDPAVEPLEDELD